MPTAYRARLIVPISSPPVPGGCVEVEGERIVAVHSRPIPGAIDLGDVAILPGLVNPHTHLEFSDLVAPLQPPLPFTSWLQSVIADRRSRTGDRSTSLQKGWQESRNAGVAAIGEIATRGWSPEAFQAAGGTDFQKARGTGFQSVGAAVRGDLDGLQIRPTADRGTDFQSVQRPAPHEGRIEDPSHGDGPLVVAFQESLGLRPERIEPELATAREHLKRSGDLGPRIIAGLSPHAPYSVHQELLRGLVSLAKEHSAPMAMHLAETREELELLKDGSGPFVEFLSRLGAWNADAIPLGTTILDYLRLLEPAPRVLVVHGNYLNDDDVAFLSTRPQFSVVYCPRTHAFFQHPPHPWRRLIASGVRVVLGTDSRASNPDLSIWEEARFLHARHPDVPVETLLRMITLDAATALGLGDRLGSLEPGKLAMLTTVPHSDNRLTPAMLKG